MLVKRLEVITEFHSQPPSLVFLFQKRSLHDRKLACHMGIALPTLSNLARKNPGGKRGTTLTKPYQPVASAV